MNLTAIVLGALPVQLGFPGMNCSLLPLFAPGELNLEKVKARLEAFQTESSWGE
jgi:hypothetical protein